MLYCYHCGKRIDEHKLECKKPSINPEVEIDENASITYVCPRCSHIIHEGMSSEDAKELSRASHAQIQRGNNAFATGMCLNSLGIIILVVSIVFCLLCNKPLEGFVTNCGEFYVFVGTMIISVILLIVGVYDTIKGVVNKRHYTALLKDLNNKTFVQ